MRLSSVNVARCPSALKVGRRLTSTGIDKQPADQPVEVGRLGLRGDTIWSKKHHGGPDQAVYVYGEADYAWWAAELGCPLEPGTFGENLTVTELESGGAFIGDRLLIGDRVVLEVTCGRTPCGTLTAHMGIRGFARRFREAARLGLYCRVIETGTVRAGDAVRYEPTATRLMSILEFEELFYAADPPREQLERALAAPICERGRREHERQLAALRSP